MPPSSSKGDTMVTPDHEDDKQLEHRPPHPPHQRTASDETVHGGHPDSHPAQDPELVTVEAPQGDPSSKTPTPTAPGFTREGAAPVERSESSAGNTSSSSSSNNARASTRSFPVAPAANTNSNNAILTSSHPRSSSTSTATSPDRRPPHPPPIVSTTATAASTAQPPPPPPPPPSSQSQAALGRGRAPPSYLPSDRSPSSMNSASLRQHRGSIASSINSSTGGGAGPSSSYRPPSVPDGGGNHSTSNAHRQTPSSSAASTSYTENRWGNSAVVAGGGGGGGGGEGRAWLGAGNQTETESMFSGGEEEYLGVSSHHPSFQATGSHQIRQSRIPLQPSLSANSGNPGGGLTSTTTKGRRPASAASNPANRAGAGGGAGATGSKGKARMRSRSRLRDEDSSSAEDDDGGSTSRARHRDPEDSINVLPVTMAGTTGSSSSNANNLGLDDDEVERRDRGEELVRRRMKERRREKKEAERRERKRREEEMRRDRERQIARTQKMTGAAAMTGANSNLGHPNRESVASELPVLSSYEDRPVLSRSSTDPNALTINASDARLYPSAVRDGSGGSASTVYPYSPTLPPSSASASAWPPPPSAASLSGTPPPNSPFFPPHGQYPQQPASVAGYQPTLQRAVSLTRSNASFLGSSSREQHGGEDVFGETGEEHDHVPELGQRDASSTAWRDEVARSAGRGVEDGRASDAPPSAAASDTADGDEREYEVEESDDDDDDDDADDDDGNNEGVEYTLKDRQDAINIEHPFGLPIWKPALYKKSRSVTRNAEKQLHSAPSSFVQHHYIPGNLLWTIAFGWWIALVLSVFAGLLYLVPFGGAKYGTVIWELAGYLFWPFGKYVEKYQAGGSEQDLKGYDEMSDPNDDDDDGDETVYEEDQDRRARDLENGGRTWGRASGRSASSVQTVKNTTDTRQQIIDGLGQPPTHSSPQPPMSAPLVRTNSSTDGSSTPTPSKFKRSVSYASAADAALDTDSARKDERGPLLPVSVPSYGATGNTLTASTSQHTNSGSETEVPEGSPRSSRKAHLSSDEEEEHHNHHIRVRALGRLTYWTVYYLLVAPVLLLVCLACWMLVFTIPMAKLLWILIRNLGDEPLALHFRSPSPNYDGNNMEAGDGGGAGHLPHIEAGQRAPRHSRKTYDRSRAMGRLLGPNSTIILCTYKALGLQYYKYTVDGVNIIFINLLPIIAFIIFDFFVIAPWVEQRGIHGFLGFITSQSTMFILALLSVIPLSYFIGMAVASISAQSSIGMGAVINATFGSIIEIILYSIALTQGKGQLVEGSIVGSLIAGVLLMPGLSMVGGAIRRKEQRFNARSAGVTSTMLIMAIIGILTPTLFYEIYGTFQLKCVSCPKDSSAPNSDQLTCRRCMYEHVDPMDDEFYQSTVKGLSYYCAVILVLSYLIGLWFSLRTHASQIWQNQQTVVPPSVPPTATASSHQQGVVGPGTTGVPSRLELPHRNSTYKRIPQAVSNLLHPPQRHSVSEGPSADTSFAVNPHPNTSTPLGTPAHSRERTGQAPHDSQQRQTALPLSIHLPPGVTAEEVNKAFHLVAATASAFQTQQQQQSMRGSSKDLSAGWTAGGGTGMADGMLAGHSTPTPAARHSQPSAGGHDREISKSGTHAGDAAHHDAAGHGGHDAPNWSRFKSYSVLFMCTVLYAVIAEILVDVVDVVLDGAGIPEKFLGVTLFALVPNTTEFMNAISFAMNGNIALSMEIGSAYAIQVCLLQIPAMIAFTAWYSVGRASMLHKAFTLVFPRWDALAIMFSVFLLTYTYIEARSNYYRGSILVLSYMVLLGGFFAAPGGVDNADDPLFLAASKALDTMVTPSDLGFLEWLQAVFNTLFSR